MTGDIETAAAMIMAGLILNGVLRMGGRNIEFPFELKHLASELTRWLERKQYKDL